MRFDYGRVKALFIYEASASTPFPGVNAYIRKRSKLCIVGETCFRQPPDTRRDTS